MIIELEREVKKLKVGAGLTMDAVVAARPWCDVTLLTPPPSPTPPPFHSAMAFPGAREAGADGAGRGTAEVHPSRGRIGGGEAQQRLAGVHVRGGMSASLL